jgi:hypothetical protein
MSTKWRCVSDPGYADLESTLHGSEPSPPPAKVARGMPRLNSQIARRNTLQLPD